MPFMPIFQRFIRNQDGNFAIILGIALVPVMFTVGAAIDYSHAVFVRSQLQQAIDAAAIAASVDKNLPQEERIQIGMEHFEALVTHMDIDTEPTFNISDRVVSANITVDEPTYFGGLMGQPTIGITVGTEIRYSVEKGAEVALVLDYSGSMGWNRKWSTMRDAAKDLIDVLSEDGDRENISFALAPFSSLMHVTLPNKHVVGQPNNGNSWTGCTQDRKHKHNIMDTTPSFYDDGTKWGMTPSTRSWYCMNHINRGLTVRPLNNDHNQVKTWLDGMRPGGNTHISLGLSFGWHLISPNAPFEEGAEYDDEVIKKFIVLLTDGAQTSPAWGSRNSHKIRNGEKNLEKLCKNIKKKDVVVITIAFDLGNGPTKARLRNCATNNDYFFEADNNAELSNAFETVAAVIQGSLHISK